MKKLAIAVLTVACLGMALPAAAATKKGMRHHHHHRHHHAMSYRGCDPCNRCYTPRRYVSRCCVRVRHCCPVRKCSPVRSCCGGGYYTSPRYFYFW